MRQAVGVRSLVKVSGVLAVVAAVALTACSKAADPAAATGGANASSAQFPPPVDTPGAVQAAGLKMLPQEGTTVHYHSHIDVNINGKTVTVPALIGIGQNGISELHTHDTTGVIHIEAVQDRPFSLHQLMTEWGVTLDQNCFSTFCTDATNELRVYVDGKQVTEPSTIQFMPTGSDTQWQEITIWYGPKSATPNVASSYSPQAAPIPQ
jgi:hypothetical protein